MLSPSSSPRADEQATEYYGKFAEGFVGEFASIAEFHGGLDALVPRPAADAGALELCRREHCDVPPGGFGASDGVFTGANYGVTTTPRREWQFVADVGSEALGAGVDAQTGAHLGGRRRVDFREVQRHLRRELNASFRDAGFECELSPDEVAAIGLLDVEVIALILYTSPVR